MWLQSHGYPTYAKKLRLIARWPFNALLNLIPTENRWNGHNASGWKSDIISVNGFDERILDGGEDKEIGDRLKNSGVRVKRIRYSAVCVHSVSYTHLQKPNMLILKQIIKYVMTLFPMKNSENKEISISAQFHHLKLPMNVPNML